MAKFNSAMFNQISGKMGGMVLNKNGTVREKITAKNPNTPAQQAVRSGFANANAAWKALPPSTQAGWSALAKQYPLTNPVGKKYNPTGRRLFISCYQNSMTAQQDAVTNAPAFAPSVLGVSDFSAAVVRPDTHQPNGTIALGGTALQAGAVYVVRATARLSPDRHALTPGDFRVVLVVESAAYPPAPAALAAAYTLRFGPPVAGAKIAFAVFPVNGDGFAGPVAQASAMVAAAAEAPVLKAA